MGDLRGIKGFTRTCRDCGRSIMFVATQAGADQGRRKWLPLDPDPHPTGNVAINAQGRAVVVEVGHPLHEGELRRHHRLSCPEARLAPDDRPGRRDLD